MLTARACSAVSFSPLAGRAGALAGAADAAGDGARREAPAARHRGLRGVQAQHGAQLPPPFAVTDAVGARDAGQAERTGGVAGEVALAVDAGLVRRAGLAARSAILGVDEQRRAGAVAVRQGGGAVAAQAGDAGAGGPVAALGAFSAFR